MLTRVRMRVPGVRPFQQVSRHGVHSRWVVSSRVGQRLLWSRTGTAGNCGRLHKLPARGTG